MRIYNFRLADLKIYLILFLLISHCYTAYAQTRITDIQSGGTKIVTFLSQFENRNYILTVTPEDEVNIYLIHDNQEKELIRSVTIPFAYITKNDLKMAKEKYFIIFSDIQIYNYDFEEDEISIYPINNPLPPNYAYSVYDKDQESVRFTLNGTKYLYYYTENRLETCSDSVFDKYEDHLILYNGSEYYYSNNYGVDKRKLLVKPSKISLFFSSYEDYALAMDSIGQVLRFNYSGITDTLFITAHPITMGHTRVVETQDYIISCTGKSTDSSYVDIYNKQNLQLIKTLRLASGAYIRRNHIVQVEEKLIFYDSRNDFTIYNTTTQNTFKHNRVFMDDFDKFLIINNKILLYIYTGADFIFSIVDLNTFNSQTLYHTSKNVFDLRSQNYWLMNSQRYYYNKTGYHDKNEVTLFSFDENFDDFSALELGSFGAGVDLKHKLIKSDERIYLCTNDLYEISRTSYQKINNNKLIPILYYSSSLYKIFEDKVLYAEENGNYKDIFILKNGIGTKIFTTEKNNSIKEICTFGNYVFFVAGLNKLYRVDISSQVVEIINDRIDFNPGFRPVFEDGQYLFYFGLDGLNLYEPVQKFNKLLSTDELDHFIPTIRLHGRNYFIFEDKICKLNNNIDLEAMPASEEYNHVLHGLLVSDSLFFFISYNANNYRLYKFDGNISIKIYEGPNLSFSSFNADVLVFSVRDINGLFLESKIYNLSNNEIYSPLTNNNVSLLQLFKYKDDYIGLYHAHDSLNLVKYDDDFSSFDLIYSNPDPISLNSTILGTITYDRILISTGRKFLYMDDNLDIYELDSITANNEYRQLFLKDSLFYFMAIGNPKGNQVYLFNYEEFTRLTKTNDENADNKIFFLHPNPATDYIIFPENVKLGVKQGKYSLFHVSGSFVQSGIYLPGLKLPIDHLNTGEYFIIIHEAPKNVIRFIKI